MGITHPLSNRKSWKSLLYRVSPACNHLWALGLPDSHRFPILLKSSSWARKCYHVKESSLEQMADLVSALAFRLVTISVHLWACYLIMLRFSCFIGEVETVLWVNWLYRVIANNYYFKLNTKDLFYDCMYCWQLCDCFAAQLLSDTHLHPHSSPFSSLLLTIFKWMHGDKS